MTIIEDLANALKQGRTINAPTINWIAAHALLERELLEQLIEAREAMDLTSPLARQSARVKLDEYLATWNSGEQK